MCKIWKTEFTCEHVLELKLSKCRGKTKNSKIEKFDQDGKPYPRSSACIQKACMHFTSTHACGPCTLQQVEEELDEQAHAVRLRIAPHSSREVRIEAKRQLKEIEKRKIEARFSIPKMNWNAPEDVTYSRKPGQKSRSKERRTKTLLAREVKPEDVCGEEMWDVVPTDQEVQKYVFDDKNWGSDFKKLGEELAEDREEAAVAAVSSDEDLEVGNSTDESDDEDVTEQDVVATITNDVDTASAHAITECTTSGSPALSENDYTTPSTITPLTPFNVRPNGPQEQVPSPAETCNPATRGRLAGSTSKQIAPTSARQTTKGEKKEGMQFYFGVEGKASAAKKTVPEGGLKVLAMQMVTL